MNKSCLRSGALLLAFFLNMFPTDAKSIEKEIDFQHKDLLARIESLKQQGIIGKDELHRAQEEVILRFNIPQNIDQEDKIGKATRSIAGTVDLE